MRLIFELIQLTGAFLYILAALRESRFLGYNMFIENLVGLRCIPPEVHPLSVKSLVDDRPIPSYVSLFVLSDADNTSIEDLLFDRIG